MEEMIEIPMWFFHELMSVCEDDGDKAMIAKCQEYLQRHEQGQSDMATLERKGVEEK